MSTEKGWEPPSFRLISWLYIETEICYISVLNDIILAFYTEKSLFTNCRIGTAGHQVIIGYDFRTNNDIFLNSLNVKYYTYGMNTHMSSIMSSEAEKVDMLKRDFGISNALRYRFTPDFMGKFSVGYDVRLPAESELLGDGYAVAPSGNLLPERNTSINLGFLFDRTGKSASNLQLELNTFYGYLENMIRFTGGYLQSQYQNFGKMRTLGAEVEVKADLTHWLYGYCNMTYQDLRDVRKFEPNTHVPNPTKGSRMPNIPYLLANAGLEFHKENLFGGKMQNTRIFTDGSFVEEYFYDFEQSRFQERRIPRTFSFDLKSGRMTATQVVSDDKETYNTTKAIQENGLRQGLLDLMYAYDIYATLYGLAPAGAFDPSVSFGDSIFEDTGVEFARRKGLVDSGYLRPELLVGWYFGVSEQEAREKYMPEPRPMLRFPEE